MNQQVPTQALSPAAVLGAGKQSEFVLRLMQWFGLPTHKILLFDDGYPTKQRGALGNTVRGSLKDGIEWVMQNNLRAIVALGSRHAALRYTTFQVLQAAGVVCPSLIHPLSVISSDALLGQNSLIMPGCVVSTGVRIGVLATLFAGVTIEHDCVIGENVTFGPGVTLSGFAQIGAHSFIGAGATIAPEAKIGERVIIGAGAVVVNDIEPGVVAIGVPAHVRRDVKSGDDAPTEAALGQARTKAMTRLTRT